MLFAATEIGSHGARSGGRPGGFLFLILLGLLGLMLVRRRAHRVGGGHSGGHGASPLNRLQQRFVDGQINQAEFEHRRAVLRSDKNIPPAPATMAPPEREPVDEENLDDES